jgi:hypothetical protein
LGLVFFEEILSFPRCAEPCLGEPGLKEGRSDSCVSGDVLS